jgi:hypothetical protein
MNLMAHVISECQQNMKFTVLTRQAPWTDREVSLLVNGIRNQVGGSPAHPGVLILFGEYSRDKVVAIVGDCFQEHKNVTGLYSPELPFRPAI